MLLSHYVMMMIVNDDYVAISRSGALLWGSKSLQNDQDAQERRGMTQATIDMATQ
jgi:hypothetical protein